MTIDNKDILNSILQNISSLSYIKPEDLPNIDLYMDQVTTFMEEHLKNNVRVLLCNNNGGMEFKFGNLHTKTNVGDYIAADNHFKNSEGWAKTNGFKYISIRTKEEFNSSVDVFISPSDSPILMEVFTTPENQRQANDTFLALNWKGTHNEEILKDAKSVIKNIIGENGIKIIKKIKR